MDYFGKDKKCRSCRKIFPLAETYKIGLSFYCKPCSVNVERPTVSQKPPKKMKARSKSTDIPASVRAQVHERDGRRCRWCGTQYQLELHHIKHRSLGGGHVLENLVTLCGHHHRVAHESRAWTSVLQETISNEHFTLVSERIRPPD